VDRARSSEHALSRDTIRSGNVRSRFGSAAARARFFQDTGT
jgi:hypothetical protein